MPPAQSLHSLRHKSQKALNQARAKADDLVSDLESRLHTANRSLEEEQNRHRNTKEEYQKALVSLHTENSKLRVEINLVRNHNVACCYITDRSSYEEVCINSRNLMNCYHIW